MQIIQKTLKDEFQNSMSKLPLVEKPEQDGPGDDINVALDQADKDPNDLGLTDEMDTTRQHDDLETSGIYDEIDIDKTSKTNEFDTTGPIDDEDMDDGYETIIFTTKKTEPKIQKKSGPDREDFMSKFQGNEFQRKWDEKISEWQDKKDKLRAEGKPIFEKPAEAQSKESKGSVRWSTPDIHSAEAFPRSSQMIRKHHSAPNQPLTNEYHPETSSGPTRSKSMPYHSYRSKTYQSSEMVSGRPPYSIPSQEMLDSAAQLYRKQFKSSSSSQQSARNLYATVARQSGERPKPPPAPPPPPPPTPPIPPKTWDMSAFHPSSHQSVNNRNARLQIEAKHSSQQLGGDQHGRRISQISTRDPSDLMFPPGSRQSGSDQYDLNAWQSEGSLPPPPFPYTPPTPLPPGSRQSGNDQYDLTTWQSEGSLPPPPLFPPGSRQSGNDQYALTTWQSEGSLPPPPILPPGSQQSGNDQYALTTWQSEGSLPPPPLPLTPPPPLSPGSRQSRNDQYDFNAWQSEGSLPPYPPPPPPPPPPRQHQRQDILPPHLRSQQSINNHKARMQMAAKLSSQQLGGDEQVRNKSQISDFIIYHRSRQSINDQNASNARLSAQRFPPPPTENQDMSAPHLSSQQSIEDHYARLQMAAKHSSQQLGGDMHARKISQISSKGLSDFTSSPRSQQSVNDQFAVNARQSAERRPSYQTESQDMLAPHLSSQQSIENRNSRLQMETKHSSRQFEGDQHSRKIPQISLKGQSNFTLPPGSRQSVNEQYVKDARQSVERLPPPQTESQDMLAPHLSRQQSIENRNSRLQIEGQHPSQHSGGDMHARKISHISSKGLSDFTSSPRSQQSVNDQFAVNARQSAERYPPYQTESQDMLAPHPSSQQSIENRNSRLQMETKHSSRQFEGDQHSRKIPKISLKGPSNFTLPPGSRQLVNEQYVKDARQSVERLPPPQTESQDMLAPHLSRQQSIENQYARLQMGARLSSQSVTHHKAGASRTLQMTESFKSHPSESEGLSTTRMGRRQISDVQYSSQTSNMLRQHPSYPNQGQDLLYPSEHPASKTSQMVKRRSSISSQGQVMSDTVQKVRSQKVQNIQNASMTTQMVDQYSTQDLNSSVPLPPSYQSKTGSLVSKPKQMTSQHSSTSPQRQNMLDTAPYISSQQSRDGKHASNTMQMTGGHILHGTQTSFIHQGFKDNLHTRKSSQMAARRLSDPMQKAAVTNLQTSHEGEKTPDIQYNSRNSMDVAKGHLSDPTHRWTHLESQRRESAEDVQYISKHSYAVSRSPQKSLHMDRRSSYESFPPPPSTWTLVSKDSRNETSPLKKDFNSKPIPYEGPLSGQRTMLHRSPPRILPPQRRASLTSDTSPLPKVLRSPPRKLLSPTVEISSERSESLPDDVSVGSQSRMLSFSNQEMSSQDKLRSMQDDSESQQNAASAPHHLPSSHEKIRSTQDVYVSPQKAASARRYIPSSQEKIRSVQDVHVSPQKAASSKRHVTSSHERIRSTQDVNVSGQIAASAPHNVLSSPDNIRSIQDVYGSPQIAASAPLNVPSSLDNIRSLQNIYGSPQKAASAPHYNIIRSVQEVSGSLQKAASAPQHAPSSTETIRSIQDVYGSLQKASSYPSRVPSSQENIKSLQDILGSPQIESSAPRHAPSSTETIRSIQEVYGSPQKAASAPRQAPSSTETIRSIQDVYGSPKIAASYPSRVPSSVESNRSIQDIYGSPQKATSAPRQAPSSPDKIRSIQDVYGSQQEAESYQRHEPSSTEKIRSMQNVYGSPPKSSSAQGSVPSSMEKIRSMQNVYGSPPKSSSAQGSVPSSTDKIRSMQDVYGSPQKSSSAQGSVPSSMEKIRSMQNVYESPPKSSSAQGSVPSSTEKIRSMQNVYGSPPQFSSAQGSVPSSKEKIRSIQDVYGSPPKSSLAQGSVPSSMEKIRSMQNVYESPPKSSSAQGSVPSSTEKIRSMQDVYGSPPKSSLAQGSVPSSMEKIRSIQDFSGYPQKAASINDDIGMKSYTSDDNVSVHSLLSITHKSTTSKSDFSSLQSRGSFTAKSDESVQSYDDLIDRDLNYT
ncbi:uncharacterized protein LOC127710116 [Mytilus californianus]|uniref:uncharacterized protein LOC127710116 n=1 Tax=Mytilus californianus TaxID=6549 RepID=UPI002247CB53|nr:uncharacterized protein LOC127710116 [Mytilus californianus]